MKNITGFRYITCVRMILGIGLSTICLNTTANDDFQQWMQQQSYGAQQQLKEFQEYKDARDKEFSAFLKANWKAVEILEGDIRDEAPKPVVMPVAPPAPVVKKPAVKVPVDDGPQPVDKRPVEKHAPVALIVDVPKPDEIEKPLVAPVTVMPKGRQLSIDFYGRMIRFYYDTGLKKSLGARVNKDSISDYWSAMSRTDYDALLSQLESQKSSLKLNDWAYASLVNQLAKGINNSRSKETALLSWFLLSKSGYRARVAYNDNDVYLLVPSRHAMFEVSYFTFGGTRYYAVDFDGKNSDLGRVYTYDGDYPQATNSFDMRVSSVVASSEQPDRRHLSFKFDGKVYNVDVTYDRGRLKFFSTYPQLNLDLYFSSDVYRNTATPLQKQLAEHMKGMDEQQAVNFLLRFVQTSLKYETDEKQFGRENYLFPEETLFYPYSDCEDRAVLFAWLVESILGLDVIGLDYPGHVAAAVKFNGQVAGDSVTYQGGRYVVTDPTYINAVAGMSMPDFKRFTPKVINY